MRTVRIPRKFFEDHEARLLPTPDVIRYGKTWVEIRVGGPEFDELLDDARYYSDPFGPDEIGDGGGLIRSAKATVRRIESLTSREEPERTG